MRVAGVASRSRRPGSAFQAGAHDGRPHWRCKPLCAPTKNNNKKDLCGEVSSEWEEPQLTRLCQVRQPRLCPFDGHLWTRCWRANLLATPIRSGRAGRRAHLLEGRSLGVGCEKPPPLLGQLKRNSCSGVMLQLKCSFSFCGRYTQYSRLRYGSALQQWAQERGPLCRATCVPRRRVGEAVVPVQHAGDEKVWVEEP
eukprot:365511-Chlamydomonas_euryale.AAC.15